VPVRPTKGHKRSTYSTHHTNTHTHTHIETKTRLEKMSSTEDRIQTGRVITPHVLDSTAAAEFGGATPHA